LERLRQVPQVVLERIRHADIFQVHPALAYPLVHFLPQHVVDQFVEIGIMRKDNVSALIPDKSLGIQMRSRVAADFIGLFVKHPVAVTEFV
jgi:hypothetical protein